nr:hypothetical protein HK105_008142 [Polyrhizophydium stewartii]
MGIGAGTAPGPLEDSLLDEQRALHMVKFVTDQLPIILRDPSATAKLDAVRYSDITQAIRGRLTLHIPQSSSLLANAAAIIAGSDVAEERGCMGSDHQCAIPSASSAAALDTTDLESPPSLSREELSRRASVCSAISAHAHHVISIADLRLRVRFKFDDTESDYEEKVDLRDCLLDGNLSTATIDFRIPFEDVFVKNLYAAMRASDVDTAAECFELDGCVFFLFDILCPLDSPTSSPPKPRSRSRSHPASPRCDTGVDRGDAETFAIRQQLIQSPLATIEFEMDFTYSKNPALRNPRLLSPRRAR